MDRKRAIYVVVAVAAVAGVALAAGPLWVDTGGEVTLGTDSGPDAIITCGCEVNMSDWTDGPQTVVINTSAGNASVSSPSAGTQVRLDNIEGSWTNTSAIVTNGSTLTVNPGDKSRVEVEGGMDSLAYRPDADTAIDDGEVDLVYSASSTSNLSVGALPADTDVALIDDDSQTIISSTTTDSQGRATFTGLDSGTHDIRIRKTPETLYIRSETNPSKLLTNSSLDIQFYVQGEATNDIVERESNDGTVNFTALPADQQFVALVDSPNHTVRRIYVPNLYEQQNIYLLNTSTDYVTKIFGYSDYTGNFGQDETVLQVQRALNGSWQTVQGDIIGSTSEYRVFLQRNVRYRLVVLNTRTGNEKVLGPYTPVTDGSQKIEIRSDGDIRFSDLGPIVSPQPSISVVPATSTTVSISLTEIEESVSSWNVTYYRQNSSGLTVLATTSKTDPGQADQTLNLTNMTNSNLVVKTEFVMESGRVGTRYQNYTIRQQFQNSNSLLSVAQDLPKLLPSTNAGAFSTVAAVLLSVLFAAGVSSSMRVSSEAIGLVVVLSLAGFSVIGWVEYGLVFASGVSWAAISALRSGI